MIGESLRSGRAVTVPRALLLAIYFVVILALLMYFRVALGPDVLIVVLIGAAVLLGRVRLFVRDWGVFLLVLILWQQTEMVARWAHFPMHLRDLAAVDRVIASSFLHGELPQVWLQQRLYHPGYTTRTVYHAAKVIGRVNHPAHWDHVIHAVQFQWYDILACIVYAFHFPLPLVVGFVIWSRDRGLFRRFAAAYLTLAGIAFIIYIVFPAVPPWMASRRTYDGQTYGVIPPLYKIFDDFNYSVAHAIGQHGKSLLKFPFNRTAAMPSLHASFPVLCAFYLRKSIGRWGWLLIGYAAFMWFAVVYMAEHWVIDVVVGLVCTLIASTLVEGATRSLRPRRVVRLAATDGARPPSSLDRAG